MLNPHLKKMFKWVLYSIALVILVILLGLGYFFRTAFYNRFVFYPQEQSAWNELRAQRIEPSLDDGWNDYPGVCHSHSELSHDSQVPFERILEVLKKENRKFICMSDHCIDGKADYSLQWRGKHEGVVFIPGFEMPHGFMPWGLPSNTVLNCNDEPEKLAREIAQNGGILFFAHSEEDRKWHIPELVGMEIYNIHTNFKSLTRNYLIFTLIPNILVNINKYHEQLLRSIFSPLTQVISKWDELNISRKIVGIAGNDCHENTGLVGKITPQGTLSIEDTSPDKIAEYKLNFFSRIFLRILFGKLEPNRVLFHIQLDPYDLMVRYVATHILARELTEESVLDALKNGRVYIGFDMIVDSTGFVYFAEGNGVKKVIGEKIEFTPDLILKMASPVPCKFIIFRHGVKVAEGEGREYMWKPGEKGKYRVEAHLKVNNSWVPWVYTNPIEVY
ncbi:MAG: hypothetical protein N3G21_12065 [Candidatus Hydrogenedentes bacterium]|nr:hypothetical protein [Candidatus Hydrogenedentota bacterium]